MKPTFKISYFLPFCLWLFMGSGAATAPDDTSGVPAKPASDFLNSIGVNSAISTRGESLEKTISITKYLGIHWIRSGYEGGIPVKDMIKLHEQSGIRFSYGLLSGGTDIPRLLNGGRELSEAGALLAFEG